MNTDKSLVIKHIVNIDNLTYYQDWNGDWYFLFNSNKYYVTNKGVTLGDWLAFHRGEKKYQL